MWEITTPTSSSVGPDSTAEAWNKFFAKYKKPCKVVALKYLYGHDDLAEDAFAEVVAKILTNPTATRHQPSTRFRAVLTNLVRNAAIDLLRSEKTGPRNNYAAAMAVIRTAELTQECDRKRMCLLTIAMIERDLMRSDFENGRHSRDFNSLDLELWRDLQRDGATAASVAEESGKPLWRVYEANNRIRERNRKEAESLLASLNLI